MTLINFRMTVLGLALILTFIPAKAQAAKGVKKNQANNGRRTMSGVVMKITPDKTGYGTFHLKTAQSNKKSAIANAGTAGSNKPTTQINQLNVTAATRFEHRIGSNVSVVNPAALKRGERVRVVATGNQAETIQILTRQTSPGRVMRYRAPSYRPHLYHQPHAHHHARRR